MALSINRVPPQAPLAYTLAIGVLAVLLFTSLCLDQVAARREASLQQVGSILAANSRLLDDLRDAQTGQRGYLLTQDESALQPYLRGAAAAPAAYNRLHTLTAGDPRLDPLVAAMQPDLHHTLDQLAASLALAHTRGFPAALALVSTSYGSDRMGAVRQRSGQLEQAAQAESEEHRAGYTHWLRLALLSRVLLALLTLLLLYMLSRAHSQLNSLLDCTSDSVFNVDRDWNKTYGNSKAGVTLPNFKMGLNLWTCFPELQATPAGESLHTAMTERRPVSYENFYLPFQTWYSVHAFPSQEGLSIFFSDITEEKQMQARLAREQELREKRVEALSRMAGGLAHEISNPLAIIHARASDLKLEANAASLLPSEDVKRSCDSIIRTADRAAKILKGLKGFTREASKDPMAPASVTDLLAECHLLQAARFRTHDVELRFELDPNLPHVLCRETQIGQILTNLLNNAFDAIVQSSVPERWVALTCNHLGPQVCIDVIDSGPGIADSLKDHLMEPFFTTKSIGGGTGIGLSLSRAIAEEHGGTLKLLPETSHTTFRLTLPLGIAQTSTPVQEVAAPAQIPHPAQV